MRGRGWIAGAAALVAAVAGGAVVSAPRMPAGAADEAVFRSVTYRGQPLAPQAPLPAGSYRNPIIPGYYPDPSVLRVGTDYYLVNSSFSHFPGLPVFHSRDLVHWRQIGNAIDRPDQLDMRGRRVSEGTFAPDISFHRGLFYIVNTCVRCGGNYVITARNPAGPWSQPTFLPFGEIDPSIFWDGDDAWIVNNAPPEGGERYEGERAIWAQRFDWRHLRMVGPRTMIVRAGVDPARKPIWIEGPHLFRRGRYIYLIAAEGGTSEQHSEVVFRATSPTGPFEPARANPILTQRDLDPGRADPVTSSGHADFVQTPAGDWWSVFLATRPYAHDLYATGRETFLLPVTWRDDWPTILPPRTPIPLVARAPALPAAPADPRGVDPARDAYSDRFAGTSLAPSWVGIRTPAHRFWRIAPDGLHLAAAGRLGDVSGVPAFLGRRQQHPDVTVSTEVRFVPGSDGARAGLAAIQNDDELLFFGIGRAEGRPALLLTARRDGTDRQLASAPLTGPAGAPVTLTFHERAGVAEVSYAVAGGAPQVLARDVDTRFLTTKQAGGFVGTVIGPVVYRAR